MSSVRRSPPVVVHATTVHRPDDVRIYHKQCRTLSEAGYRVYLAAPVEGDETREFARVLGTGPYRGRRERLLKGTWRTWRRLRGLDAAVYHVHDPELLPLAWALRIRGKRVIYDMHEHAPAQALSKSWIPAWLRRGVALGWHAWERLVLPSLPVIFAERSYQRDYPFVRTAEVVLNLPDVRMIDGLGPQSRSGPFRVAYLGGITSIRGIPVVLRAIDLLRNQGHDIRFRCAGPVRDDSLETVGEAPWVEYQGVLPPGDAYRSVAEADLGMAVLADVPNYRESYPTKMFEYMALGMPVVASDFPLYREVLEDTGGGWWVDPESPEATAQVILNAMAMGRDRLGEMGRSAASVVRERYTWASQGEKLLAFYRGLGVPDPRAYGEEDGRGRRTVIEVAGEDDRHEG